MRTRISEIDFSNAKGERVMTPENGGPSVPDYFGNNVFGPQTITSAPSFCKAKILEMATLL